MKKTFIMAVSIDDRLESSQHVQQLLSDNGKMINLRCGLHETGDEHGMIIMKIKGSRERVASLDGDLNGIEGVKSKYMEL